jgi:hypothetical protein
MSPRSSSARRSAIRARWLQRHSPERRASSLGQAVLPRLGSMSGLLRPVGPEAAQTYWARRGLVLGATMVLAVAVLLIISGANIGSAVHTNPSPSTAGLAMPSSASPSSTIAVRPSAVSPSVPTSSAGHELNATTRTASRKKTHEGGPADCPAEQLRPTLTGKQRLALKRSSTFHLSLINGSDQTCRARVTRKNFELKIYSGNDRIWSTADCRSIIKPISQRLGSEHAIAWSLTWDGKRSKSDCRSAREALRPGTYRVTAQLQGAEPVQLRMLLRE